jgi:hypothetical protein
MHLLTLLSRFLVFPTIAHHRSASNGTQASPSVYPFTRHTQLTPSPPIDAPSTTMLATMPCTPFPGRAAHEFESIVTAHHNRRPMMMMMMTAATRGPPRRRRPERQVPRSTYDLEAVLRGFGRELGIVEIVFVEWLVLCWLEMEDGEG